MKIALIGASNSFFTMPFSQACRENKHIQNFKNFSIGGSCNLLAIKNIDEICSFNFDYAFLDFSVNEILFTDKGSLDVESLESSLDYICFKLIESKIVPVILLFPAVGKKNHKITNFYREYAKRNGLPIFDMYIFIKKFEKNVSAESLKSFPNFIFENANHISHSVAEAASDFLIDKLIYRERRFISGIKYSSIFRYFNVFEVFTNADSDFSFKNKKIVNSFLNDSALQSMDIGLDFCFKLPSRSKIVGYVADFANSSCFLEFKGLSSSCINMGTTVYRGGRKHVVFVLPMPSVRSLLDGHFNLRIKKEFVGESVYSQWKNPAKDYSLLEGEVSILGVIAKFDEKIKFSTISDNYISIADV